MEKTNTNSELYNNYIKALKRKYNAVLIDVDEIADFKPIIELINRSVPIIFLSYCELTQITDLRKSLYDRLKDYINDDNVTRIYLAIPKAAAVYYNYKGYTHDQRRFCAYKEDVDKSICTTIEKFTGISNNNILKIGSFGDVGENDYGLLNNPQGFSINKTSGRNDVCFPVFDENGNILKGPEALTYLVKNIKLVPGICLNNVKVEEYRDEFAKAEAKLIGPYYGVSSQVAGFYPNIHDGGIKIPICQLIIRKESPELQDFWLKSKDGKLLYALYDENNCILRGASTYYYFLSQCRYVDGHNVITKQDVLKWYDNYLQFFTDAHDAVMFSSNVSRDFMYGILDNCRNVLLILLNLYLHLIGKNSNILFELTPDNKIYSTLLKVEKCLLDYGVSSKSVIELINQTQKIMLSYRDYEFHCGKNEDYSKIYRAYRESDNLYENMNSLKKKFDSPLEKTDPVYNARPINTCGICYGGIELPILLKAMTKSECQRVFLLKFSDQMSSYMKRKVTDLGSVNLDDIGGMIYPPDLKGQKVRLFDDNILTGKTLQLAINVLCDCGIVVDKTHVVRYPNVNRLDQMFFNNTTAVNYRLYHEFIEGLKSSSTYSRKDDAWLTSKGDISGSDSFGIFDLTKEIIYKNILKNHLYSEDSEVAAYQKRLYKLPIK